MNAAAIVVGIDAYTGVPALTGSVQDALDVTAWLIEIGVAASRIRLHLGAATPPTLPAGITALEATRDAIWASFHGLQADSGDTLFVFLSGHGYYLARSGPIFLAQDWSAATSSRNLGIRAYADYLQGLKFHDTLLVVDACQNLDVDSIYHSPIQASPPDDQSVGPNPARGLLLCCATEQEQYAPVVDGRGLLTRTLLKALRDAPDKVSENAGAAYVFDWLTGTAKIDLEPLFRWSVSPDVIRAAQAAGHVQRPTMVALGRLSTEWRFMACDAPVEVVPLKITAEPLEGLQSIKVGLTPPARELELPLTTTPPMPFTGFAPRNRRLAAMCRPNDDWDAAPPFHQVPKTKDAVELHFTLKKLDPDPDAAAFNIRLATESGDFAAAFTPADYQDAEIKLSMAAPGKGAPRIIPHETGPDIVPDGAPPADVERLVRRMEKRFADRMLARHPNAAIVTAPPGQRPAQARPNVRLDFPRGGPAAVAGLLVDEPLIRVERIGAGGGEEPALRASATSLSRQGLRRLEPGAYRIVVETPWGEGATSFQVGRDGVAPVTIPEPVGTPPLRNRRADAGVDLVTHDAAPYRDSGLSLRSDPAPRVFLDAGSVTFLPPGLSLLVARSSEGIRAEPFSSLAWPEWDMLIGAGRLTAVDLGQALGRIDGEARETESTGLLRLAVAYGAWAQEEREHLARALDGLSGAYAASLDARLLKLTLRPDPSAAVDGKPFFRWAHRLAREQAPHAWRLPTPTSASVWAVYAVEPYRLEQAGSWNLESEHRAEGVMAQPSSLTETT